jgi:hypothetical protein
MYVHKIYGHRVFFSKYLDILKYVHRTNGASTPIYGQRKGIVPLSKHAHKSEVDKSELDSA